MARIYDNIEMKFTEGLQGIITNVGVKRVDFCVGYFNLRGWNIVVDQVDTLTGDFVYEDDKRIFRKCRLLIGMHQPSDELIRQLYTEQQLPDANYVSQCKLAIAHDFRRQLQLGFPTKQDEFTLRRLSAQMKDEKVCVKLYLREPLHAKLYLAHRPDDNFNKIQAIMGSSNLTYSGLTKQGELNAEFGDSDSAEKLASWFDDRWEDKFCLDITKELIEIIDNSWAGDKEIPPYYIYLKTAYHLSEEARSGIKEFSIPTEFRGALFDFQQTAVKIAARHLNNEKRGGAMIGDVVGLGKTITACAIAKMYENTFGSNTLIICPANLQDMWAKYRKQYDMKADIMSMSKPIDVDNARYYKLIIVDESHNLRNSQGIRYRNIRDLIQKQDCKVLLLTATPYNKQYKDLSSQLRLFIDDDMDLGIRPEAYIRAIGGERKFAEKHEDFIRSIKAFERSECQEDWQELMKLFLIRRTRTFIKENYAKTDLKNNRKYLEFKDGHKSYFPDRIPKAVKFNTVEGDQYSRLYSKEMIDFMESLKLPRYGLTHYLDEKKAEAASKYESNLIDNLSRAGAQMMGFCKSTFFKRIDSSGYAFLLTLYRHILRNAVYIYAIDNKLKLPVSDENTFPEDFLEDADINDANADSENSQEFFSNSNLLTIPKDMKAYMEKAETYYNGLIGKNNVQWIDSKYFKRTLKQGLKKDCEQLLAMINLCEAWNPQTDQKLNELEKLLSNTHKDEKVVVFTQYSDTANYIYKQLEKRGIKNIEKVTGATKNSTSIVERFSPISNKADIEKENELRILIATDVLSEGQNLQDAHIIVNYDLPWAIIRLIQRAGRVDRIDQSSEKIYCYSFFPADEVEKIISLRTRLNKRINENAGIVGSDEVFFEGNEQNLLDMYNEKSGSLDGDDDDVDVDLGSFAYQIWKNATDANPKLKNIIPAIPNIAYSTKAATNISENGVITYARTYNDFDVLTWYNSEGKIVSQSQNRILQAMACTINEPCLPAQENHLALVEKAVKGIKNENTNVGGILGSRFSTKRKIYELLNHYYEQPLTLFNTQEKKELLKFAIDQIYNNPLLENSKFILGRMMRTGNTHDDIVDTVIEMYENANLCRVDEDKTKHKDPVIICSMGLKA
ncbi:helicase-related protein [Prevotella pallens]|jgi:helicase C-terminal domain protein|uniref:helicase-related protein n=1 Tax=Prevotella pallens TaxID=60133 RepID=UPI001CB57271|nr:helicase-related protein [Prevotella pallens]MBF1508536.1 helicase [Prevotella pallens]MBF1510334.1 helicase [Prevotella pallens]